MTATTQPGITPTLDEQIAGLQKELSQYGDDLGNGGYSEDGYKSYLFMEAILASLIRLREIEGALREIAEFGCDEAEQFDGPCAAKIVRIAQDALLLRGKP